MTRSLNVVSVEELAVCEEVRPLGQTVILHAEAEGLRSASSHRARSPVAPPRRRADGRRPAAGRSRCRCPPGHHGHQLSTEPHIAARLCARTPTPRPTRRRRTLRRCASRFHRRRHSGPYRTVPDLELHPLAARVVRVGDDRWAVPTPPCPSSCRATTTARAASRFRKPGSGSHCPRPYPGDDSRLPSRPRASPRGSAGRCASRPRHASTPRKRARRRLARSHLASDRSDRRRGQGKRAVGRRTSEGSRSAPC